MATNEQLAWAAGLFEGEGKIRYYRDQLALKLSMNDLELVFDFYKVVQNGNIRPVANTYEWSCHRQKECREVMIYLWPYLGSRTKKRWNEALRKREEAFSLRECPVCLEGYKPIRKKQVCCSQACAAKHTRTVGKYTDRKSNKIER